MSSRSSEPETDHFRFGTTQWSHILTNYQEPGDIRDRKLEWLYLQYRNPIYSYLRRERCLDAAAAEDKTQEFFAYLIEHEVILRADPSRGRFRTFIRAVLRNFLLAEGRWDRRQKRGGGKQPLSLDVPPRNGDGSRDVVSTVLDPEAVLDQQWAEQVVELSRAELVRQAYAESRVRELDIFEAYTQPPDGQKASYRKIAKQFGMSDWEIWKTLSVMRDKLRTLIRSKIAETVENPDDVEDEMEYLMSLVR